MLQLCLNKTSNWKKNNHNCWRNILSYTYTLHNWNARQKKCFIDLLLVEIRSYRKNELEDVCSWVVGGKEYFLGSGSTYNDIYEPTRNVLLEQDESKIHNPHERVYSNIYSNTCKYEKLSSASNTTSNVSSDSTSVTISSLNTLIPRKKYIK